MGEIMDGSAIISATGLTSALLAASACFAEAPIPDAYDMMADKVSELDTCFGRDALRDALNEIISDSPDLIALVGAAEFFLREGDLKAADRMANAAFAVRSTDIHIGRILERTRRALLGGASERKYSGFCHKPFEHFETLPNGSVHLCCSGWLPKSIGNIKTQTWQEIWNSSEAQEIRQSIHDGSYRFCNPTTCPILAGGGLNEREVIADPDFRQIAEEEKVVLATGPRFINFSHDYSCNLACPTCRKDKYVAKGAEREELMRLADTLLPLMNDTPSIISMTGSGDPFGSQHFRHLIKHFKKRDAPALDLQTNGVLFDQRAWDDLELDGKVRNVLVSMDASSEDVYAVVRRFGDFGRLMDNLRFIADLRRRGKIAYLRLDYVVQARNYRDIPGFIGIARALGVDQVYFNPITNWGTFTPQEFAREVIWSPEHPEFTEFVKVLRTPTLRWPRIWWGALSDVVNHALSDQVSEG